MELPFYIHASLPSGESFTLTVERSELLIGRTRAADLRLLHPTVSAQHARITQDDNANWILEDLGSRNGIVANANRVDRLTIEDDAIVEIGSFTARFSSSPQPPKPQPARQHPQHTQQIDISRLGERDSATTSRKRLAEIASHGQRLWAIDSNDERRLELCNLFISPLMNAWSAAVLRLDTSNLRTNVLAQSSHPDAPDAVTDYISQSMLRAIADDPAPALGRTHDTAHGEIALSIAEQVSTIAALVCRLDESPDALDVAFITLPPARAQQATLFELAMIAEQYRGATAAAALRHHRAETARQEQELAQAHKIQQNLLPDPRRAADRGAIVHAKPCTEVGGDYADVIPIDDHRTLLAVADVAGKGMHAALVAAQIHSLCNFSLNTDNTLPDLAKRLNRLLAQHVDVALFASAALVLVNKSDQTLSVVNAGHPPPLIASPDGTIKTIGEAPGPPLGILDETPPVITHPYMPGDTILLYTDGLSEARTPRGQLLGVEGVIDLFRDSNPADDPESTPDTPITAHTPRPLRQQADNLIARLEQLNTAAAHQHDDQTFLLARLSARD